MPSGKIATIDPEPTPLGNVGLFRRPDGSVSAEVLEKAETEQIRLQAITVGTDPLLGRSHFVIFVTCPQRDSWRQR